MTDRRWLAATARGPRPGRLADARPMGKGKEMRIVIVAPPWLPVPPPAYGGTEAVLDSLARGLKAAGHDVLLFTTGDSTCEVERGWFFEHAIGVGVGGAAQEIRHVVHAYDAAKERRRRP